MTYELADMKYLDIHFTAQTVLYISNVRRPFKFAFCSLFGSSLIQNNILKCPFCDQELWHCTNAYVVVVDNLMSGTHHWYIQLDSLERKSMKYLKTKRDLHGLESYCWLLDLFRYCNLNLSNESFPRLPCYIVSDR